MARSLWDLPLSPALPARPDAAQGDEAGENPSCRSLCVQKAHNDHQSPPTNASLSSPAPKTLPLPLSLPDVSPPQALCTSPMLWDDFLTGRKMAVRCPGDSGSGAHLELKGRGSGQKGKSGNRRPQKWVWGRGHVASAARVSQVSYSHLSHFRLLQATAFRERKLGFVVPD